VVLMSDKADVLFLQDTTDAKGKFTFLLPDHDDNMQFNLQVNDLKGTKQDFDIITDVPDLPHFATPVFLKQRFYRYEMELAQKIKTSNIDSIITGSGKGWLTPVTVTTVDEKEAS